MTICERSYPRQFAFSYLDELAKEFSMSYGNEVEKRTLRPYAFVKFGKNMLCVCVGYHILYSND